MSEKIVMTNSSEATSAIFGSFDVNVRMIDQGSCELNIIVGIEEHDYTTALNAIYNEFVK